MYAFIVIAQDFDNAALVDTAMCRAIQHPQKFSFQRQ
jgi:hypothetical protein